MRRSKPSASAADSRTIGAERSSSSRDPLADPTTFLKFEVDWENLALRQGLVLAAAGTVSFLDEQGQAIGIWSPQGADFSSDGRLLYVLNGNGRDSCASCGIHVFEVHRDGSDEPCWSGPGDCTARRVARSTNGSGSFNFDTLGPGTFQITVSATDADADWTGDASSANASR